jgi:hypothetical protein
MRRFEISRRFVGFVFLLLTALTLASTRAADAQRFELLKGIHYYQVADGAAHLKTNNAFRFSAEVWADVVGDVLASSVYTPISDRLDLLAENDGDPFRYLDKKDTLFVLETTYPDGNYSMVIRGLHDGDHTMTFNIAGGLYPAGPVMNNYEAAQTLVYDQYNEISWQPFGGATANDFIQLHIEDIHGTTIWETPDFTETGALNGLATHAIIPARTLSPDEVYNATLRFVKVVQSSARQYPGVHGAAGYYSRTDFAMRTASAGVNPLVDRVALWKTKSAFEDEFGVGPTSLLFVGRLDAVTTNQIASVTLTLPDSEEAVFSTNSLHDQFDLSDDVISRYGEGAYTLNVGTFAGTTNHAFINFPPGNFSQFPEIQNVAALNNHPATQDLVIAWAPWTNAVGDDFIRVELFDGSKKVWDTPTYSSEKRLAASATSVTIPATNLIPGHIYDASVHFHHVTISDASAIPGAIVFGGFDSLAQTRFATQAPDVSGFGIAEGQYFFERTDGIYEADPRGPFRFEATASAQVVDSIRSAQLTFPNGGSVSMAPDAVGQNFIFYAPESSADALATQYPAGAYRFSFDTLDDGVRIATANLSTNQLPPLPHILNFSAYRAFAAGAVPIQWDNWQSASKKDLVSLTVEKLLGGVIYQDSMTATTNLMVIPNKQLSANNTYIARLRFEHKTQFASEYPGVSGTTDVFSEVAFYITTLDLSKFRETPPVLLATGEHKFTIGNLLTGRTYVFSFSQDLVNWTSITQTITNKNPSLSFTNAPTDRQFFRTELLP